MLECTEGYANRDRTDVKAEDRMFTTRSLQSMTFGVSVDSVSNIKECVLMYYSMLHAVDDENKFILDANVRDKATHIMCPAWNPDTILSTHGGGYLVMESENIIVNCDISLEKVGYFGDNDYNNLKS